MNYQKMLSEVNSKIEVIEAKIKDSDFDEWQELRRQKAALIYKREFYQNGKKGFSRLKSTFSEPIKKVNFVYTK